MGSSGNVCVNLIACAAQNCSLTLKITSNLERLKYV